LTLDSADVTICWDLPILRICSAHDNFD
jgi:hypothetical protein